MSGKKYLVLLQSALVQMKHTIRCVRRLCTIPVFVLGEECFFSLREKWILLQHILLVHSDVQLVGVLVSSSCAESTLIRTLRTIFSSNGNVHPSA